MKIYLSPQFRDDALSVTKAGDILTINGFAYDFGPLPDGAMLPISAHGCPWISGDVARVDGVLQLTLTLPLGADASEAARFPAPIESPADGDLDLPDQRAWDGDIARAQIDWDMVTYPDPITPAEIRAECARRMAALVAQYSPEERETWPIQVTEAQAVMAGQTDGLVMLPELAKARGLPLATFAGAVLQVANATKAATAHLLAAQAKLLAMPDLPADFGDDRWWNNG